MNEVRKKLLELTAEHLEGWQPPSDPDYHHADWVWVIGAKKWMNKVSNEILTPEEFHNRFYWIPPVESMFRGHEWPPDSQLPSWDEPCSYAFNLWNKYRDKFEIQGNRNGWVINAEDGPENRYIVEVPGGNLHGGVLIALLLIEGVEVPEEAIHAYGADIG